MSPRVVVIVVGTSWTGHVAVSYPELPPIIRLLLPYLLSFLLRFLESPSLVIPPTLVLAVSGLVNLFV